MTANRPQNHTKPVLQKKIALADLSALQKEFAKDVPEDIFSQTTAIQKALKKLQDDAMAITLARRHGFIKTGLELVTKGACPLCDTPWNKDELQAHLEKKLVSSKEMGELLETLDEHIIGVMVGLSNRIQSVERAIGYCKKLDPAIDHAELESYLKELKAIDTALAAFQQDHSLLEPAVEAANKAWWTPGLAVKSRSEECYTAVKELPDVSAEQEARDYLVVAQDRYKRLSTTTDAAKHSKAEAAVAKEGTRSLWEHFNRRS